MTLLIVSQFVTSDQPVAYGLLLGVAACLRTGFDGLGFWWGRPVMSAALLDMTRQVAASTTQAALALTTFRAIFGVTAVAVFFTIGTIFGAMGPAFYGWLIGINAEGKSLEDVTRPLTAADQTSTTRPAPTITTTPAEA